MKTKLLSLLAIVLLSGCATNPKSIQAIYISPLKFSELTDEEVISKMEWVSNQALKKYIELNKYYSIQAPVGVILAGPLLTTAFTEPNQEDLNPDELELATLFGQYRALKDIANERNIDTSLIPKSPQELIQIEEDRPKPIFK